MSNYTGRVEVHWRSGWLLPAKEARLAPSKIVDGVGARELFFVVKQSSKRAKKCKAGKHAGVSFSQTPDVVKSRCEASFFRVQGGKEE